jgi:hypothetical protein
MYFEVIVLLFLGARVFGVTELAKTSKTQICPHILEFVEDPQQPNVLSVAYQIVVPETAASYNQKCTTPRFTSYL